MSGLKALKFGDVVQFRYASSTITAMVVATDGSSVETDEMTVALGDTDGIVVFGLAIVSDPGADTGEWHAVGKTAELSHKTFVVLP